MAVAQPAIDVGMAFETAGNAAFNMTLNPPFNPYLVSPLHMYKNPLGNRHLIYQIAHTNQTSIDMTCTPACHRFKICATMATCVHCVFQLLHCLLILTFSNAVRRYVI